MTASCLYAQPAFRHVAGNAWRPGGRELTLHGLALCAFAPGQVVADVGCGAGATLELLRARGVTALGLDRTRDATGRADALADAARLPLATASLHGLVCECVLSLLPDGQAALRGFARVLRPGGRLLLSDVHVRQSPDVFTPVAASAACAPASSCLAGAVSRETMEGWMTAAGLRVEYFADHRAALRDMAAHLLWHGLTFPRHCARRYSYGLWTARKEAACIP